MTMTTSIGVSMGLRFVVLRRRYTIRRFALTSTVCTRRRSAPTSLLRIAAIGTNCGVDSPHQSGCRLHRGWAHDPNTSHLPLGVRRDPPADPWVNCRYSPNQLADVLRGGLSEL